MKKSRIIALALTAAIASAGVGYAAWTEKVVINNSVATGELKVEFDNTAGYPKLFGMTGENVTTKKITPSIDKKSIDIELGNFYPGAYARYELKIVNDGTIPAAFDNAKVASTEDQAGFLNALQTQVFVTKYHKDGTQYSKSEPGYWAGKSLGFQPAAKLEDNLNNIMAGLTLNPGEFITFDVPDEYLQEYLASNPDAVDGQCVEVWLPSTVGSSDMPNLYEKAHATFNITINWKQNTMNWK